MADFADLIFREVRHSLNISVEPTVEPVTIAEAKTHLKIIDNTQDREINEALIGARKNAEELVERQFINATYILRLDQFPIEIELQRPPISSVSSVQYVDTDGVTQTLATDKWTANTTSSPGRIIPAYGEVWPATRDVQNAVTVTFIAGYGAAATAVPEHAKRLIKLLLQLDYYGYPHKDFDKAINYLVNRLRWRARL